MTGVGKERPLYLDIEEANRRDARAAGEFAPPPATTDDPVRGGEQWAHPGWYQK